MPVKGASDLNRFGELQEDLGQGRDDLGQAVEDWRTVSTVWFNKAALGGAEVFQSQQVQATASYLLTLRYRTRSHARMRIVERGGRVLAFDEPPRDPDGRRQWLEVRATEADLEREGE